MLHKLLLFTDCWYTILQIFSAISIQDIRVGDIIQVKRNEDVPADIALLVTSHNEGIGYVETTNLDGENNLKIRKAIPQT